MVDDRRRSALTDIVVRVRHEVQVDDAALARRRRVVRRAMPACCGYRRREQQPTAAAHHSWRWCRPARFRAYSAASCCTSLSQRDSLTCDSPLGGNVSQRRVNARVAGLPLTPTPDEQSWWGFRVARHGMDSTPSVRASAAQCATTCPQCRARHRAGKPWCSAGAIRRVRNARESDDAVPRWCASRCRQTSGAQGGKRR